MGTLKKPHKDSGFAWIDKWMGLAWFEFYWKNLCTSKCVPNGQKWILGMAKNSLYDTPLPTWKILMTECLGGVGGQIQSKTDSLQTKNWECP